MPFGLQLDETSSLLCVSGQMSFVITFFLSFILGTHSACTNQNLCTDSYNKSAVYPNYFVRSHWNLKQVPSDIPAEAFSVILKHNVITEISVGAFSHLSRCHTLSLTHNQIMSLTPTAFHGLVLLKLLNLGQNEISLIQAKSFADLPSLQKLILNYNSLSIITNGSFVGLQQLRRLYLNNNNIWKIENGALFDLDSLLFISIANNKLVTLEPDTFVGLSRPFYLSSFCARKSEVLSLCWLAHEVHHQTIYIFPSKNCHPNNCRERLLYILLGTDNCGLIGCCLLSFEFVVRGANNWCMHHDIALQVSLSFQVCALNQEASPFPEGPHMLDLTTQVLMSPTHMMMEEKQLSSAMKMEHGVTNQLAQVRYKWNKFTGAAKHHMVRYLFITLFSHHNRGNDRTENNYSKPASTVLLGKVNVAIENQFCCVLLKSVKYIYLAEISRTQTQPAVKSEESILKQLTYNVHTVTTETTTAIETEPEEDRNGQPACLHFLVLDSFSLSTFQHTTQCQKMKHESSNA